MLVIELAIHMGTCANRYFFHTSALPLCGQRSKATTGSVKKDNPDLVFRTTAVSIVQKQKKHGNSNAPMLTVGKVFFWFKKHFWSLKNDVVGHFCKNTSQSSGHTLKL